MMKRKLLEYCLVPLRAFWANPVVVRDLRAQMRGTKSYWFQGAYLLLLGILAISGYAQATGQNLTSLQGADVARSVSIVEAQDRLEGFYYFIFLTLAALITLIAPALTAGSVIGERQRQSLDLLITTPLTAGELLIGKMLSSIAFLGLLLALSLPASALCVLLGGATLGDVFRIYVLLAVDGIALAAIGLFFSCAARTGLLALVWTYLTVAAVIVGTGMLYLYFVTGSGSYFGNITQVNLSSPIISFTALNPFVAVSPAGQTAWSVGPLTVPVWLGTAFASALILRLLVTAATYRLGAHGAESGPSLRRQALLLSAAGMFLFFYSIVSHSRQIEMIYSGGVPVDIYKAIWHHIPFVTYSMIVAFLLAVPFLPGLFVPVSAEDAPPGTTESSLSEKSGIYRMSRAFHPEHSGALPYLHLWVIALVAAAMAAVRMAFGVLPLQMAGVILCAGLFISGLGFCFWSISRFAANLARGVTQARAIAFAFFALLCAGPMLVFSMTLTHSWNNEPAAVLWLLYPLAVAAKSTDRDYLPLWLLISGMQALTWGFAFVLAEMRWRRAAVTAAA